MEVSELYKDKKKTLSFEIVPPEKNSELSSIDETLDMMQENLNNCILYNF